MRKRILVAAAAGLVAVALVGGVYVYFFSSLRAAPAALGLSATPGATSTPTSIPTSTPATGSAVLAGKWTVASGSLVGYRVQELFVGQTSKHLAVARTSTVSGGLTVSGDSSGYTVSALTLTAGLADLNSVDTVLGRDVSQRDGVVRGQLDVQQFPDATFTAVSASVLGTVTSQQVAVTVTGKLTIHGVTKDVTVQAKAQVVGAKIEIAGTSSINMTDYGVSPPQFPFTTVDSAVIIEFDVFMTKAG